MKIQLAWWMILLLGILGLTLNADEVRPGEQVYKEDLDLGYWLYLPPDYTPEKSWPLVLFLHGRGSGRTAEAQLEHGPPANIERGEDFPFILVSPRSLPRKWWSPDELEKFLNIIMSRYSVDSRRVYLTGLSMGGFGSWSLGARAPDYFAAIAPICGGGDPAWAPNYGEIPIRAYHGAYDKVVKPEKSKEMVAAIQDVGGNAELIMLPKAAHVSWPEVYNDPEFWAWLLSHKREKGVEIDPYAEIHYRLDESIQLRLTPQTSGEDAFRGLHTTLHVDSQLELPCSIEATVVASRGIAARPSEIRGILASGTESEWAINFVADSPVSWSTAPYCQIKLRVSVTLPDGEMVTKIQEHTFSFAQHIWIEQSQDSPVIDGTLQTDLATPIAFIDSEGGSEGVQGTLMMVKEGLYLAFRIKDSSGFFSKERPVWEQDSLEVRLDLRPPTEWTLSAADWDDVLPILIAPGEDADSETVWKPRSLPTGVYYAASQTDTGYSVELLVPRHLLPKATDELGTAIRLNVAQNDFDGPESGEKYWYSKDWKRGGADSAQGVFVLEH